VECGECALCGVWVLQWVRSPHITRAWSGVGVVSCVTARGSWLMPLSSLVSHFDERNTTNIATGSALAHRGTGRLSRRRG
jgi:hypothetical protein